MVTQKLSKEYRASNAISPSPSAAESAHTHITVDGQCPLSASPGVPHLRFNRRASEASLASQVSGLADSYTASNMASSKCGSALPCVSLALRRTTHLLPVSFPPCVGGLSPPM